MVRREEFEIKGTTLVKYNGRGGDVVIPYGITEIGGGAFLFAKITRAAIPDSVTYIGAMAFKACAELTM